MSLAVAIQMDPIDAIDIEADSTFVLALEAQARGHRLYHYLPQQLSLTAAGAVATVRPLEVRRELAITSPSARQSSSIWPPWTSS